MRHFISKSVIMAELHHPQHGPKPQLLSGDDLKEEKDDAAESAKKKRRKKKRNKNSAPGEIRAIAVRWGGWVRKQRGTAPTCCRPGQNVSVTNAGRDTSLPVRRCWRPDVPTGG